MRATPKRRIAQAQKRAGKAKRIHQSEVARQLGVTPQALYKAAQVGRLKVHRVGRRVLISEEENAQFFAEMRALLEVRPEVPQPAAL